MNTSNVSLSQYAFDTVERIARFLMHINDLDKQFYSNDRSELRGKTIFLRSYEKCLSKLIECVVASVEANDIEAQLKKLETINLTIKSFQDKLLIHLPRPIEPVELRRFIRVIKKQIIQLEDLKEGNISVHINDNLGDLVYASDPLEVFKSEDIGALVDTINEGQDPSTLVSKLEQGNKDRKNLHISIPRTDASNPSHWPTLLHEVSHVLMNNNWFPKGDITNDFLAFVGEDQARSFLEIGAKIDLRSWLIECWCDLFACALIGPAFYFSQSHSFTHNYTFNDNKAYPPNYFRLKLIAKFIEHRFPTISQDAKFRTALVEAEDTLRLIDLPYNRLNFNTDEELSSLFNFFNLYFIREFFTLNNGSLNFKDPELNALFAKIAKYVSTFDIAKINSLVSRLNDGLPIPSHRTIENDQLTERVNYVQEILLAEWLYKNGVFRSKILSALENFINDFATQAVKRNDVGVEVSSAKAQVQLEQDSAIIPDRKADDETSDDIMDAFRDCIVKEFQKLDQSILRSIQVSEWFDLLSESDGDQAVIPIPPTSEARLLTTTLCDSEIYQELVEDRIKVIPLINIHRQLGATSLDIRLGTSFEVFFPNQFGTVDFTKPDTIRNLNNNSKYYNLDYLESIPINPGQFILGHSMEYLKLPSNLSATLDGRGSFARLGIGIHITAGLVDPGFEGVLTFEIFNAGTNPIMLYPGLRIGQLTFSKLNAPNFVYAQRHTAKYLGLLEHQFSRHGEDYEIANLSKEKARLKH